MTPEILEKVREVATDPAAAEKLCGAWGVEYHPLACDIVQSAVGGDACHPIETADAFEDAAGQVRMQPHALPLVGRENTGAFPDV